MAFLQREYTLPPFGELRLITANAASQPTKVILQQPLSDENDNDDNVQRADIFGTDLLPGVQVQLPCSRSLRIFSPTGCTIVVTAPPSVLQRCYATMCGAVWTRSVVELHSHLEALRMEAKTTGGIGPRVLFVSDRHAAGSSTYTQLLTQYAVRLGYHPLLIDGVPSRPHFGYPSCVSLYQLQHTIDVEEEMSFVPGLHAVVGAQRDDSPGLYVHGLHQLLGFGMEKMARSDRCRVGGLFMDYGVVAPEEVEKAEHGNRQDNDAADPSGSPSGPLAQVSNPLDTLLDVIMEADVDHVFVVQSAWLRFKLAQRAGERMAGRAEAARLSPFAPNEVNCENGLVFRLFLVDSVDCVTSFAAAALNRQRWMQYFFGTPTSSVKPTLLNVETAQVRIASVGAGHQASLTTLMPMMDDESSAMPTADPAAVSFLTTQDVELKGRVVGISTATEFEALADGQLQRVPFAEFERRVRQCLVRGFALVESVTPEKLTLLLNNAALRKDLGLCLLLTEEYLTAK